MLRLPAHSGALESFPFLTFKRDRRSVIEGIAPSRAVLDHGHLSGPSISSDHSIPAETSLTRLAFEASAGLRYAQRAAHCPFPHASLEQGPNLSYFCFTNSDHSGLISACRNVQRCRAFFAPAIQTKKGLYFCFIYRRFGAMKTAVDSPFGLLCRPYSRFSSVYLVWLDRTLRPRAAARIRLLRTLRKRCRWRTSPALPSSVRR